MALDVEQQVAIVGTRELVDPKEGWRWRGGVRGPTG